MIYQLDETNGMIEFFLTDDYGREVREAMSFMQAMAWLDEVRRNLLDAWVRKTINDARGR